MKERISNTRWSLFTDMLAFHFIEFIFLFERKNNFVWLQIKFCTNTLYLKYAKYKRVEAMLRITSALYNDCWPHIRNNIQLHQG